MFFYLHISGYLWSGAFVWWVAYLTRWTVNPEVWGDCKLDYFLYYFSAHFSCALICVMSIEKFLALYFPLKAKAICTVKTAKWVCLITGLIYVVFDSHFFFVVEAYTEDGYDACRHIYPNYEHILYRIDAVLSTFGPFSIMIATNSAIIYKFMKAKYNSKKQGNESTNQAISKSATKGTIMLVTVSFAFIILSAPIAITYVITKTPHPMLDAVIVLSDYLNHSINTALYCISGSRFRGELMKTLLCHKKNKVGDLTTNTMNSTVTK